MRRILLVVIVVVAGLGAAGSSDPLAEDARNVRLVGYHDLQGREALVVTTLSDAANGSWVYVGHHESYWDGKPKRNPITGKDEWNGTSILDVADPSKPKLVWHIPNDANRNSRSLKHSTSTHKPLTTTRRTRTPTRDWLNSIKLAHNKPKSNKDLQPKSITKH